MQTTYNYLALLSQTEWICQFHLRNTGSAQHSRLHLCTSNSLLLHCSHGKLQQKGDKEDIRYDKYVKANQVIFKNI